MDKKISKERMYEVVRRPIITEKSSLLIKIMLLFLKLHLIAINMK